MASLISSTEDTSIRAAMANLHDTWAKPIVIYSTRTRVVISTNPNHIFLYNSGPNQTQTTDEVVKTESTARIRYKAETKHRDLLLKDDDAVNLSARDWDVRMIVPEAIKTLVEKAERVEFNGTLFQVIDDSRPHGVISYQFQSIFLKALN